MYVLSTPSKRSLAIIIKNVQVGQADHLAVVAQLRPEEDESGAGRPTIQPDIIRKEEFQQAMTEVFSRCEELKGDDWWQAVIQGAHEAAKELRGQEKRWNAGVKQMEEALRDYSILKIGGLARDILTEQGVDLTSTGEAYKQLATLLEKERGKQHKAEVLAMAKDQLKAETEYEPTTRQARRSQAAKLLQQLITRRQMAAVTDVEDCAKEYSRLGAH